MALWLCRAGKLGEYETKFIEEKKICGTWPSIDWSLSAVKSREDFTKKYQESHPNETEGAIRNYAGQLWAFSHRMAIYDIIVLPSKIKSVIYIGRIKSDCRFDPETENIYKNYRIIEWIKELPRATFEQDLLYSFGAFMTFCEIKRNDAEARVKAILAETQMIVSQSSAADTEDIDPIERLDLEGNALQEIADQIIRNFKGHGLARIIAAILEAKGFKTYISPPGPDKGVDILAAQGKLGFDTPRICVQVKSSADPVDRPTLDQLIGAMSNHKAEFGMLVSWGGFKSSVINETANHFFKVRLWSHKDIVQEFLIHYEDLPDDICEMIPLKRIWIMDNKD